MQMLYNSDSYAVLQFDLADEGSQPAARRGGFEIVDKFARKDIFLEGALAARFHQGVQDLVAQNPAGASPDALDEYIAGFTEMAQHPLVLH